MGSTMSDSVVTPQRSALQISRGIYVKFNLTVNALAALIGLCGANDSCGPVRDLRPIYLSDRAVWRLLTRFPELR